MFKGKKGISPLITSIFILAITVAGIIVVLNIGQPAIERAKENSIYTEAQQNIEIINSAVNTVVYGGEGTSRRLSLSVTDGQYLVNESSDTITFEYTMQTELLPAGICERGEKITTKTFGTGRVLDLRFREGNGNVTHDCSKYENRGTLEPNETHGPSWTAGNFGNALGFDGINDFVKVPDDETLSPKDLTVSLWVKPNSVSGTQEIIGKTGGGNQPWRLFDDDGKISAVISGSSHNVTGVVDTGAWQHFVLVFDSTESMVKLYENSTQILSESEMGGISDTSDEVLIGTNYWDDYFNGTIDEVRIYDRALGEDEIDKIYRGGHPGYGRELRVKLEPEKVNITNDFMFGKGTNNIFFENKGYSYNTGETQIKIKRV